MPNDELPEAYMSRQAADNFFVTMSEPDYEAFRAGRESMRAEILEHLEAVRRAGRKNGE